MIRRFIALLTALFMLTACTAVFAESTEAPAADVATEPVLLVTVNGEQVFDDNSDLMEMVNYYLSSLSSNGYDITSEDLVNEVNQYSMDTVIRTIIVRQHAAEMGLDQFTDEELAAFRTEAEERWEEIVQSYMSSDYSITDESSDEDKTAARADTLATLEAMGYTQESFVEDMIAASSDNEIINRVQQDIVKDITISDEEVLDYYNGLVEEDKESYENDISNYEFMTQYYGSDSYYIPDGYRGIIHILLEVDEDLLNTWKDLTARFEEQQQAEEDASSDEGESAADEAAAEEASAEDDAADNTAAEEVPAEDAAADNTAAEEAPAEDAAADEAAAETEAEPEATEEPVTQEMIDAAEKAIMDSVQPTVDEIMTKYNAGTSFEDLIAEYGTDPGMTDAATLADGYHVHPDGILYDADFVKGAMSLREVGDVSDPVLTQFGIHILKYLKDIPGGPVELTETMKEELRGTLLSEAQQEAFYDKVDEWFAASTIEYTEAGEAWKLDETAAQEEVEGVEEEPGIEASSDDQTEEAPQE